MDRAMRKQQFAHQVVLRSELMFLQYRGHTPQKHQGYLHAELDVEDHKELQAQPVELQMY
jgi:hypothetical protein